MSQSKIIKMSPNDIDLLLAHLHHTKEIAQEDFVIGGKKMSMIKLA